MSYENLGPSGDFWVRESWSRAESHAFVSVEGSVKRRGPDSSVEAASEAAPKAGALRRVVALVASLVGVFALWAGRMAGREMRAGRLTVVKRSGQEGSGYACPEDAKARAGKPRSVRVIRTAGKFGEVRSTGVRSRGA